MTSYLVTSVIFAFCIFPLLGRAQSIPKERVEFWRANAPTCTAPSGFKFVGKQNDKDCDDGDITLFAGLLCASGESLGCDTVRRSQDSTGRWFRSPRRKETNNLGGPNSFSPDMALGSQLYIVATADKVRAQGWINWLDRVRPCVIGSGDDCVRSPFLRFCTDDDEKGCTVRPGDAAVQDATLKSQMITPPTEDVRRLLSMAGRNLIDIISADSIVNKPGYSQHLTAVEIYLLRRMNFTDGRLGIAAALLSAKQPLNPFFAFLSEGKTTRVRDLVMNECPSPASAISEVKNQWAWEREDKEEAWKNTMLWDCIFMANLLK